MTTPSDSWWKTFFSGLAVEVQRRTYPPEQTRSEADFIEKTLGLRPGAALLDVPCGDGRLALELASRGHRVTGVDLNGAILEDARRGALERRLEAAFEERDMRDLPWPGRFDAAFCFGNSFAYLDDPGNQDFLSAAARALRPGGRFLLHYPVLAEAVLPGFHQCSWHRVGEALLLIRARHDHRRGRVDTEYVFIQGRDQEQKTASYRAYTFLELSRMLEKAGFVELVEYGSTRAEPFRSGSKDFYLAATRG